MGVADTIAIAVEKSRGTVVGLLCISEETKLHVDHIDGDCEGLVFRQILIVEWECDYGRWHVSLCWDKALSIRTVGQEGYQWDTVA